MSCRKEALSNFAKVVRSPAEQVVVATLNCGSGQRRVDSTAAGRRVIDGGQDLGALKLVAIV